MSSSRSIFSTLLCLWLSLGKIDAQDAFQSGPRHSDTVAGGIAFDPTSETLFVTGAKYEKVQGSGKVDTSCFLGKLSPALSWVGENSYGQPGVDERCSGLAFGDDASSMILIGSTQAGSGDPSKNGFMVHFGRGEYQIGESDNAFATKTRLPSPVSVAASGSHMVVASMVSNSPSLVASSNARETSDASAVVESSYAVIIHKFSLSDDGTSVKHDWMQEISDVDDSDVFVGGLFIGDGVLLLAGSTASHSEAPSTKGLLAKMDLGDGTLLGTYNGHKMSNVTISAACGDTDDLDYFYVVGTGLGHDDNMDPMIAKIHYGTHFSFEWISSLHSVHPSLDTAKAYGMDCEVDGDVVYFAGTVKSGAHLQEAYQISSGMDDIFVAQANIADGSVNWVHQVGSSGMDHLAYGGGLSVDISGSVAVYGNTDGSLFREKAGESNKDVFIMTFDKDGSHTSPREGSSPNAQGTGAQMPDGGVPLQYVVEQNMRGFWASLIVPFVLVAMFTCFICYRDAQIRAAEAADQRRMMSIFKYVHAFDVEDIDIRRSPAGGYHGTYLNDLADGIVGNEIISSSSESETDEEREEGIDELEERFNRSQEFIEDLIFMEGSVKTRSPSSSQHTPSIATRGTDRPDDQSEATSGPPSLVDDSSARTPASEYTGTTSSRTGSRDNSGSAGRSMRSSDHAPTRVVRSSSPEYSESTERTEHTEQSKSLADLI